MNLQQANSDAMQIPACFASCFGSQAPSRHPRQQGVQQPWPGIALHFFPHPKDRAREPQFANKKKPRRATVADITGCQSVGVGNRTSQNYQGQQAAIKAAQPGFSTHLSAAFHRAGVHLSPRPPSNLSNREDSHRLPPSAYFHPFLALQRR